ncbi:receptor kinase-like protein Xa21 [Rosa rugosa]|uniref:receptor kinase-like protein Xa21 n=1 Tax=Rosa rugosa TaxID=74645 RepID=UPI002B4161B8|nr:receptor kinase-like protein Xa21 [Rosa rugosa]
MSSLNLLALSTNNLNGSVPDNMCQHLPNLQGLYLSNNNFDGQLPSKWSQCKHLLVLSMGYNISGSIPKDIGNLTQIKTIYLGSNYLTGTIPNEIGHLPCLEEFVLGGNNLSGLIPTSIFNMSTRSIISLDSNQFSGNFPANIGLDLPNLQELLVGANKLSRVPEYISNVSKITNLDLPSPSNPLKAPLPISFRNLSTSLETIKLSNCSLRGYIANDIGNLSSLTLVALDYNLMSGSIPTSVGRLHNLQDIMQLDMSSNSLIGPLSEGIELLIIYLKATCLRVIPKSLEALSSLQYLNFSFNRLQGEIPTGGPFKNFSGESFLSNHGLCGAFLFQVSACRRKTEKEKGEAATETTFLPQLLWRRVSYQELLRATNGFTECSLLGDGGFGSVYKGTLSDGMEVAIKVFNLQLEGAFASFDTECEMLSNIRHRNLVKVISCCGQIGFKALVLNYMPNWSLDKWLYFQNFSLNTFQNFSLNTFQRLNILIDVVSALEYLHNGYETPIVHCDLKPSNVLLDYDMGAHVADFGIAKSLGGGDSMTRTMTLATIGYMAPEYGMEGMVTRRGDVYSFGIVVMETFTRRKPIDEIFAGEMSLKLCFANSLHAGAVVKVVDATLLGIEEDHEFMIFVSKRERVAVMRLAVACSVDSQAERVNMQEALATLKKIKIKFLKDVRGGVEQPSSSRIRIL